jgi:hypothetical protein
MNVEKEIFGLWSVHKKIYLSGKNGINKFTIINCDDYEIVSRYKWWVIKKKNGKEYATSRIDGNLVRLHRFLLKPKKNYIIDHINGDGLDNRRINLRICSDVENKRNFLGRLQSNNKSGCIGVNYRKDRKKWRAYIDIYGKYISLGSYKQKKDAINARMEANKKYGFISQLQI